MNMISKFNGSTVLAKLHKPRSPIAISFIVNEDDTFLIHLIYFKTKSGNIQYEAQIIQPDFETRVNRLISEGYVIY
jgi:hypothetical protein